MAIEKAASEVIDANRERFWELAEPVLADPPGGHVLEEGTMMGSSCLRVNGDFAAMIHSKTGQLIVKLSADRVLAEIDAGAGSAFSPNDRVFKEWLGVDATDDATWSRLIRESVDR